MRDKKGFTLVELMIVVVILGILAAIAIPLYMKFVQQSKTGEAQGNLAKIGQLVQENYAKTANVGASSAVVFADASTLIARLPGTTNTASCGATAPRTNAEAVPLLDANVQNKTYQPGRSEWRNATSRDDPTAASNTAWDQMKFSLQSPIRYKYCYTSTTNPTADPPVIQTFSVFACGDLDGDSTWSEFSRQGTTEGGTISIGPLAVLNEDE
jgi:prepilin-type N-terminal cleavage/methylation domain-containing protein